MLKNEVKPQQKNQKVKKEHACHISSYLKTDEIKNTLLILYREDIQKTGSVLNKAYLCTELFP